MFLFLKLMPIVLIDTAIYRSLINPSLAYKKLKKFIKKEMFNIQTAHDITTKELISPTFLTQKGYHKFYLFIFSKK